MKGIHYCIKLLGLTVNTWPDYQYRHLVTNFWTAVWKSPIAKYQFGAKHTASECSADSDFTRTDGVAQSSTQTIALNKLQIEQIISVATAWRKITS